MTHLLPERRNPLAQLAYFLSNFLRRFHTVLRRHVRHVERSIKPRLWQWRSAFGERQETC
jgi:hypothetical protein